MFRFVRLLRILNKQWLIMINCMCVNAFWCVLILVTWFRVCEVHQLCSLRTHYFLALRTPPLPNKRPRLPLPDVPPAFSDVAMPLSEIASLWIFAPLAQKETKETKSTEMTLCICLKRQHGTSFRYFCFFTLLSFQQLSQLSGGNFLHHLKHQEAPRNHVLQVLRQVASLQCLKNRRSCTQDAVIERLWLRMWHNVEISPWCHMR